MFSHQITVHYNGGGAIVSQDVTLQADGEDNREISFADDAADQQVALALDVSAIKALLLLSDQDLTVETNDDAAPDDTLSLTGGVPLLWYEGCGYDCPLSVDVTDLYLTAAGGAAGTLKVQALQDSTP